MLAWCVHCGFLCQILAFQNAARPLGVPPETIVSGNYPTFERNLSRHRLRRAALEIYFEYRHFNADASKQDIQDTQDETQDRHQTNDAQAQECTRKPGRNLEALQGRC